MLLRCPIVARARRPAELPRSSSVVGLEVRVGERPVDVIELAWFAELYGKRFDYLSRGLPPG
jgi:hypothetical protein